MVRCDSCGIEMILTKSFPGAWNRKRIDRYKCSCCGMEKSLTGTDERHSEERSQYEEMDLRKATKDDKQKAKELPE